MGQVQDDDKDAGSAGAMATARWRERKAQGSFMVPVELFKHEVDWLVRRGLVRCDQVDDRYAIGDAVARLVEAVVKRTRPVW